MGIMMPETCWDRSLIINTRLVASYSRHNQCRTPYTVIHSLVPLKMGIMMPETCWDRSLIINTRLVASHSKHNQCRTPYAVIHSLVLLKMGVMMPETCWGRSLIINTRLIASCWFLFLHPTFMMHGHTSLKSNSCYIPRFLAFVVVTIPPSPSNTLQLFQRNCLSDVMPLDSPSGRGCLFLNG